MTSSRPSGSLPPDRRTLGRTGRWALLAAVVAGVLLLLYRWMTGDGVDLPTGQVARRFDGVRPGVLLVFLCTVIGSLTLAGVSLSERDRPRAAAITALVLSLGLLVTWVAVI